MFAKVDIRYRGMMKGQVRAKLADGIENMTGLDTARNHLGEHGLEHKIIFIADEMNIEGEIGGFVPSEFPCRTDSGKSTTKNHHLSFNHVQRLTLDDTG